VCVSLSLHLFIYSDSCLVVYPYLCVYINKRERYIYIYHICIASLKFTQLMDP
jgi:hypothetical protein